MRGWRSSCASPPDRAFLRLVFAGTPEFAERSLSALLQAGHEIVLVLTQPDRPAGRGMRPANSAVKRLALAKGLDVFQPENLKSADAVARVRAANGDATVVAAYGILLPQALLDAAPSGALNIHASLLPRWRGAAPIQRALLAGDRVSGISIMQMDAGMDTGPLLAQKPVDIVEDEDAGSLHDKLALLGGDMIVAALRELEAGSLRPVTQGSEGATYARKIDKKETEIDWARPALDLERAVRAFRPAPGAVTLLGADPVKIWRARAVPGQGQPGTLIQSDDELVIASGRDCLAVSELQRSGGKRVTAAQFARGYPLAPGTRFGPPAQ